VFTWMSSDRNMLCHVSTGSCRLSHWSSVHAYVYMPTGLTQPVDLATLLLALHIKQCCFQCVHSWKLMKANGISNKFGHNIHRCIGFLSSSGLDSYSRGSQLESRLGHQLFWRTSFLILLSHSRQDGDSFPIMPRPFPMIIHCHTILSIYLSIYLSTAHVDLGRFFSFLIYTQSIGLLGRGISLSQVRYLHTEQQKHNAQTYPCFEWDSNPRSKRSSGRKQFMH
jgi:hypothetical protein